MLNQTVSILNLTTVAACRLTVFFSVSGGFSKFRQNNIVFGPKNLRDMLSNYVVGCTDGVALASSANLLATIRPLPHT